MQVSHAVFRPRFSMQVAAATGSHSRSGKSTPGKSTLTPVFPQHSLYDPDRSGVDREPAL